MTVAEQQPLTHAVAVSSAQWHVERLDRSLGRHIAAWEVLAASMPLRHPMLSSTFVETLLQHFGDGQQHLCWLGEASCPQAMCILERAAPGTWRSFLPMHAQVGPMLTPDIGLIQSLFAVLPGLAVRIELLCCDPAVIPVDHTPNRSLDVHPHALTIEVGLAEGFDAYWTQRSKKLRDNLRRSQSKLASSGESSRFVAVSAPEETAVAVARYADLESLGWKGEEGTALVQGSKQTIFYSRLLEKSATTNDARVYELWWGDRLIASRLMMRWHDQWLALKTCYHPNYAQFAPGRVLMQFVIATLAEPKDAASVQFGTNAGPDMLSWATKHRRLSHLTLFRHPTIAVAIRILATSARTWRMRDATLTVDASWTVNEYESIPQMPAQACDLLRTAALRSLQLGPEWFEALQSTVFKQDHTIRYFVLQGPNGIAAVVPTRATRGWGGFHVHSLSNYYTALYAPAIQPWVKPIDLVPLVRHMLRAYAPVSRMQFAPMDPNADSTHQWQTALRLAGLVTSRYFTFGNWTHESGTGWTAYLAQRSAKLRSNIKRSKQRLEAAGGRVELITEPSRVVEGMAAFNQVYGKSWKQAEPHPEFFESLARTYAKQGRLRLGVAWLSEQPIAAQWWTVNKGVAEIHKLAYDEAFKDIGAGTVLTAMLMEHVLDHDHATVVDYLIGDDAYKRQWMNHRQERWGLECLPVTRPAAWPLMLRLWCRALKAPHESNQSAGKRKL